MKKLINSGAVLTLLAASEMVLAQGGIPCQGGPSCGPVTTVAEPSSLVLLGLAAAGFVLAKIIRK